METEMKTTSVPEQALYFYIQKFIDAHAQNNTVRIGKYRLDIAFCFNGKRYDVEYDSYSAHHNKIEKDIERNKQIQSENFLIYRIRDNNLPDLPYCKNIHMQFDNYSKKHCCQATEAIIQLFEDIGIVEYDIDVFRDLDIIKEMYHKY
jgi:very-short-patch-repair endonuclease